MRLTYIRVGKRQNGPPPIAAPRCSHVARDIFRKFRHSTSEETLSKYAKKQQGKDSTSNGSDDSSEDREEASEGDDEDSECENLQWCVYHNVHFLWLV